MSQNLTTLWIAAAVAVSVMGVLLWKKKKHSFVKVGTISKLYFFPVKSLRGIEIKEGKCTKQGFEVNGLLDRSFMWVSNDFTQAVDCGDEAASFFQAYLNTPDARLVRHFSVLSKRQYQPKGKGKSFERQLRKENPNLAFQSLAAFHVVSKPSVDDLNSKLQGHKVCLSTTVDPDTGDMNIKEPLKTLRKYRIPTEPEILEKTGPLPCLGIGCEVLRTGDIAVGDDVLAAVGPQPKMREK
ncbi:Mitochondrial amidoxime reducing component 2 like protein [Argiope bruennichi]|uniref:Mitochondrial amidoxime reducing component 2 like protein n=1 Tax=Argiope bruennichi TaxID=94029 RepID=A0A8T0FS90_ARGBR|nr:Mitochondrial amidoxime reducing component 2 like protein [Argiope bruennichi]